MSGYSPMLLKSKNKDAQGGNLLKDQLQIIQTRDSEGRVKCELKPISSQLSFDKGFYVFMRAIQLLTSHKEGPLVVGVAGPSGSGKTAFCDKVLSFMPEIAILHMDNYNVPDRLIDGNFDDPRLTDYELLLANIKGLKGGQAVETPIYDFKTSSRVGYKTVQVPSSRVVIVEGIYALSERLRPLLDLRVSITGGVHFDLVKRVIRDVNRSGQAPEEIIQQIADTVYPMYKAYIEPDLATAHLKVYNNFNPFTGFMEPTFILKSDKAVAEDAVRAVFEELHMEELTAAASTITASLARSSSGKTLSPATVALQAPEGRLPPLPALAAATAVAGSGSRRESSAEAGPGPIPPEHASPVVHLTRDETETNDIYLLPPHEDPETCSSWLRMRNRDGRYSLMFEENMVDGPFIISPRISFEVSVRLLGGLMALGYQIGAIMKRHTVVFTDGRLTVKLDDLSMIPESRFVQIHGKDRDRVREVGRRLGLEGTYSPKTYIEQVQLSKLESAFSQVPELMEDLKTKMAADDIPIFEEAILGTTPPLTASFIRGNGFKTITGFPSPLNKRSVSDIGQSAAAALRSPISEDAEAGPMMVNPAGPGAGAGAREGGSSGVSGQARGAAVGSETPPVSARGGARSLMAQLDAGGGGGPGQPPTANAQASGGTAGVSIRGPSPAESPRLAPAESSGLDAPGATSGAGGGAPSRPRSARSGLSSELSKPGQPPGPASAARTNGSAGAGPTSAGASSNNNGSAGGAGLSQAQLGQLTSSLSQLESRMASLSERVDAALGNRDLSGAVLRNIHSDQEHLRTALEGIRTEMKATVGAQAASLAQLSAAVEGLEAHLRRKGSPVAAWLEYKAMEHEAGALAPPPLGAVSVGSPGQAPPFSVFGAGSAAPSPPPGQAQGARWESWEVGLVAASAAGVALSLGLVVGRAWTR